MLMRGHLDAWAFGRVGMFEMVTGGSCVGGGRAWLPKWPAVLTAERQHGANRCPQPAGLLPPPLAQQGERQCGGRAAAAVCHRLPGCHAGRAGWQGGGREWLAFQKAPDAQMAAQDAVAQSPGKVATAGMPRTDRHMTLPLPPSLPRLPAGHPAAVADARLPHLF